MMGKKLERVRWVHSSLLRYGDEQQIIGEGFRIAVESVTRRGKSRSAAGMTSHNVGVVACRRTIYGNGDELSRRATIEW